MIPTASGDTSEAEGVSGVNTAATTARAPGPPTRTTARAPGPGADDTATMVSSGCGVLLPVRLTFRTGG